MIKNLKNLKNFKNKKLLIIVFTFFILCLVCCLVSNFLQQDSVLKIGISSNNYTTTHLPSYFTDCSLFKEKFSTTVPEVAQTTTKDNITYLSGINPFYFSDGTLVNIEDIKNTYSRYLSFDSKDNILSSTPLTTELIKKLIAPITKTKNMDTLTCGRYLILSKNFHEIILTQNTFYPGNKKNKIKKIILKNIDLNERNESDVLSDLLETRLDILINTFTPQKSFTIISKYPQILLKTIPSSAKAVLLIKKSSFTEDEITSFLSQIDVSAVSKIIYNSTIIPILSLSNKKDTTVENSSPKEIYFASNSSIILLRSVKVILSKINTKEFSSILQITNSDIAQDIIETNPKTNMALVYIPSDSYLDVLRSSHPDWYSYPLWQYQDLILFNKNIKNNLPLIEDFNK